MSGSSAETEARGLRLRRRPASVIEATRRAEEALRTSIAEAAERKNGEAAQAALALDSEVIETPAEVLTRDAYSAPAGHITGVMTRQKLGFAFWLAVTWVGVVIFAAVFANLLPIYGPHAVLVGPINQAPSWKHWFGTDNLGHDLFSQVVYGSRISMIVGFVAVAVGLGVGGTLGLLAGFYRGAIDAAVVWVTDALLTVPALIFALTILTFLGSTTFNEVAVIALFSMPIYARISRAASLVVSQSDFVLTALSLGAKRRRILVRDVAPLVMLPIAAYTPIGASAAILVEGALAYLGIAPATQLSWGDMISAGQQQWQTAPQSTFAPLAAFFLTLLALNFIGQKAGNVLDPRQGVL